jgi:hypothetical protein
MKKLNYVFITMIMFCGSTLFAQEKVTEIGKISSGESSLEIPTEIKSKLNYDQKSSEFVRYEVYSEKLQGSLIFILDSKNYLVSATIPNGNEEAFSRIGSCFKQSFWGLDGGGWSSFLGCCLGH